MAKLIHRIQKVIKNFNFICETDLQISRIVFWNRIGAQYVGHANGKGWIFINPQKNFQIIEEDVLHELGHALIHQYCVKKKDLQFFWRESPNFTRTKAEHKEDSDTEPPYGFVSWYATVTGTEDFCETLSAWASNQYQMKNVIYGNWKIPVSHNPKLKRKFFQIQKILKNSRKI